MIKLFSLTIEVLENGWDDMEIIINRQPMIIYFECVPNAAFGDLLKSVNLLINRRDSKVIFPNGSKQEVLGVNSIDSTNCQVTIGGNTEEMAVKRYVRAVLRMFDKYIHAHNGNRRKILTSGE